MRLSKRSTFDVYDIEGVKLLTQLRVEFSNLNSHCSKHNFLCSSPSYSYQTGMEDNLHLSCTALDSQFSAEFYLTWSLNLLTSILCVYLAELCNLLSYDHPSACVLNNRLIIEDTSQFVKSTRRFKRVKGSPVQMTCPLTTTCGTLLFHNLLCTFFRLYSFSYVSNANPYDVNTLSSRDILSFLYCSWYSHLSQMNCSKDRKNPVNFIVLRNKAFEILIIFFIITHFFLIKYTI